jgi:hypothetical protein
MITKSRTLYCQNLNPDPLQVSVLSSAVNLQCLGTGLCKVPGTKSLRLDPNIRNSTNIKILKCLDRWTVHAVIQ